MVPKVQVAIRLLPLVVKVAWYESGMLGPAHLQCIRLAAIPIAISMLCVIRHRKDYFITGMSLAESLPTTCVDLKHPLFR